LRGLCTDLASGKADRKDLNDTRSRVLTAVEGKADAGELQQAVANFGSDHTQRLLELRGDISQKLAEMHSQVQDSLTKKANYDDLRQCIE